MGGSTRAKRDLSEVISALLRRRDELVERSHPGEQGRRAGSDPLTRDMAEEAERDLDDATRAELALIRGTLDRIDGGRFGLCVTCGHAIEPHRLDERPYAVECGRCRPR